jgi:uncharacterized membrane-anchored protein
MTDTPRHPLPADHPQRAELHDEVHARPPERLVAPLRISYLALLCAGAEREAARAALLDLVAQHGGSPPPPGAIHHSVDLGGFRLKWEQHTEFYRLMVVVPGADVAAPFDEPAIGVLPAAWLQALPGRLVHACHVALLPPELQADPAEIAVRDFRGGTVLGGTLESGLARAFSDFRIQPDGFARLLIEDRGMQPRQAGRLVQALLEIDTYRIMALLALPVARELGPFLSRSEAELAEVAAGMVKASEADEPVLLARLTRLAAEIESREAATRFRFDAAFAYHALVERRIAELREERIEGLGTLREITERRLAPAIATCHAASSRQDSLSRRVARATTLLSTRVDITREKQNGAVLESMNRRAKLQLRLQQTVEGLSVAAITYYLVGLIGYVAKGVSAAGFRVNPDIAMAVGVPAVALLVGGGVRRLRRFAMREDR